MKNKLLIWLEQIKQALNTPLIKAGTALIASSLAGFGFGFLYWVVAARLLSAAEVGIGSATIASITFVASLSMCGMDWVGTRFLPLAGQRQRWLARQIHLLTLILGLVGSLLFLAASYYDSSAQFGICFIVGTAFFALFIVQDTSLLGLGLAKWVPIKHGFLGVGRLLLLILLVQVFGYVGWQSVVGAWFVCMMLATLGTLIVTETFLSPSEPEDGSAEIALPTLKEFVRFALVNHVSGILLHLPPLAYPMLVLHLIGEEASAYFYTSWMISNVLMFTASHMASALVAEASRPEADIQALIMQGTRYMGLIILPGIVLGITFGQYILLLFGADYQQGYSLLVILLLASPIYALNVFIGGMMRVWHQLTPVFIQGGVAGVIGLGLVWLLAPAYGLSGFGIAFVIGQSVAALVVLLALWQNKSRQTNNFLQIAREIS